MFSFSAREGFCVKVDSLLRSSRFNDADNEQYLSLHYQPYVATTNKFNIHQVLAPCVLYIGQAFGYFPENAFYIFNQQIYFIIRYLLDRSSLI